MGDAGAGDVLFLVFRVKHCTDMTMDVLIISVEFCFVYDVHKSAAHKCVGISKFVSL